MEVSHQCSAIFNNALNCNKYINKKINKFEKIKIIIPVPSIHIKIHQRNLLTEFMAYKML